VASGGGHLVELRELVGRLATPATAIDWVTSDRPQGRSLLRGERATFVRAVEPREVGSVLSNVPTAVRLLRSHRYDAVVASGALALSFIPVARATGVPCHFFESITRTDAPSVTGRLLAPVPGVRTYTQHPSWADGRWLYRGSLLDAFEPVAGGERRPVRRVVVTLGMNPYPFRRLVERLAAILPPEAEVLWQVGVTDTAGLGVDARGEVPEHELRAAIGAADVVVAHAGAGSAVDALESGRVPVLVARLATHGEQVDDHQLMLLEELLRRDLCVAATVDELTLDLLGAAASRRVRRRSPLPPLELA
jgi:UDP-N-acetylglucosamine transferase subunit ALG13